MMIADLPGLFPALLSGTMRGISIKRQRANESNAAFIIIMIHTQYFKQQRSLMRPF